MGLMKYRSEKVSLLHQGSLQDRTRYLCLISSFLRLWQQRTEKDNAREEDLKSRGSVFRGKLLNSGLSDITLCRAT